MPLLVSCSYEDTQIEVGSLFDPTWDFSENAKLSFDKNYVEVINGKAQLKSLDLLNEEEDFNRGTHYGTVYEPSSKTLQIKSKYDSSLDVKMILPEHADQLLFYLPLEGSWESFGSVTVTPTIQQDSTFSSDSLLGEQSGTFDGTGDYVSYGDIDEIDLATELTGCAWAKHTDITGDDYIFSTYMGGGSFGISFLRDNVGSLSGRTDVYKIYLRDSDGQVTSIESSEFSSPLDSWTHICFTFKANDPNGLKLYVNGLEDVNSPATTAVIDDVNSGSSIFRVAGYGGAPLLFNGLLDEVTVWQSVLSPEDIQKLYFEQSVRPTELSSQWTPHWSSVVGYWKMNGQWLDSSGRGHHGTPINSPDFSSEKMAGSHAVQLDANEERIEVASHADFNLPGQLSILAWVKPSSFNENGIILRQSATAQYALQIAINGKVRFNSYNGIWNDLYSDDSIPLNEWTHIALTRSASSNVKIYVNGQLVKEGSLPATTELVDFLKIGSGTAVQDFDGLIDDVALFSVDISAEDVAIIYHRQKQSYSAHYDSEVIDLGSSTSQWPELSWSTRLPFGKELVGDFDRNGLADLENSASYPSLEGNLSDGLLGYWPLNESTADTLAGGKDFEDMSAADNHCDLSTGSPGATGYLGLAIKNGTRADCGDIFPMDGVVPFTFSFWFRTSLTTSWFDVMSRRFDNGSGIQGYMCNVYSIGGQLQCARQVDGVQSWVKTPGAVNDGRWRHGVFSFDGNDNRLYVNGQEVDTVSDTRLIPTTSTSFLVGENGTLIEGMVDEVALWDRAITASEVKQLYRRGANRVKFQVKTCVDEACECESYSLSPGGGTTDCDGDTILNSVDLDDIHKSNFAGPGGDAATHYSELFNRKSTDLNFNCGLNNSDSNANICRDDEINFLGGVLPTLPILRYADLPLAARPQDNRYFQYRLIFEAEENSACSGKPCQPELLSVNLNPGSEKKYFGGLQEIKPTSFISYSSIHSMDINADDCATFQLSPNGVDYYYWNGTQWGVASNLAHRSSLSQIENYIPDFSQQLGPGRLFLKAFLQSNGDQTSACAIQDIDISYSR